MPIFTNVLKSSLPLATGLALFSLGNSPASLAPSEIDIPEPPSGVDSPGVPQHPLFEGEPEPDAPTISAITETTLPDETLSITGSNLDGATLQLWVNETVLELEPLRSSGDRMQTVIPKSAADGSPLPVSTYLVWPTKADGAGAPIRVNAPTAWWCWPARAVPNQPGQTIRVFGKNFQLAEDATPTVILVGSDGTTRPLEVREANPYHVTAKLPETLPAGNYRVQIHNGTGGIYGWSEAVTFEAAAEPVIPDDVFEVEKFRERGDDDRTVVEKAIAAAVENGGGTVLFAARSYNGLGNQGSYAMRRSPLEDDLRGERTRGPIVLPEGTPIVLKGVGMGERLPSEQTWWGHTVDSANATIITDGRSQLGETIFVLKGDGQRIEDMTIQVDGLERISGVRLFGKDQAIERVRFLRTDGPYPVENTLIECFGPGSDTQIEILDCELYPIYRAVTVYSDTDFVRIAGCKVFGQHDRGRYSLVNAIQNLGGNRMILENNFFTSVDKTAGKALGRTFLSAMDPVAYTYLAGNRTEWVGSHTSIPGAGGNGSEQYLLHVGHIDGGIYRVVSASEDGLVLEDSANELPEDLGTSTRGDWAVLINSGRGAGQWRLLTADSKGANLQIDSPWRVQPDETSKVNVQRVFHRNIIYNNFIDASPNPEEIEAHHKTVGVYWYHNCVDNVTAGNTMKNLGTGVALSSDNRTFIAWNDVRENSFENMTGYAGGTSVVPVMYNEVHRGEGWAGPREDFDYWINVGNVFRSNQGKGAEALVQMGWLRFDQIRDPDAIVFEPSPDKGFLLGIVENNALVEGDRGVLLSAPSTWTLFRNNHLALQDGDDLWEFLLAPTVTDLLVIEEDAVIEVLPP